MTTTTPTTDDARTTEGADGDDAVAPRRRARRRSQLCKQLHPIRVPIIVSHDGLKRRSRRVVTIRALDRPRVVRRRRRRRQRHRSKK